MSRPIRMPCVKFAREVLRVALTLPQEVLLAVTVDGVQPRDLDGERRQVARALFGDVEEVDPALRRILIWRLGRASGKTTLAAVVLIWAAWTSRLRGGRGHVAVAFIVSPTTPLAKIAFGVARELVRESAMEAAVARDVDDVLVLVRPDGRRVEIRSVAASRGGANLRGRDVIVLVVDESEFMGSGDDAAVVDADQVGAVTPRLIEFVILSSTPWPSDNQTAELFDRNYGHPVDALAARGPSMLMRPSPQLEQDRAREMRRDEANAAREYDVDAGAMRGGTRWFDAESIAASVDEGRPPVVQAAPGSIVGAGGDVAFDRDSSAVAVVGRDAAGLVTLLEYEEVRPARGVPLVPGVVISQHFAPIMRRHGARQLWCDGHYRRSVEEHLLACELGLGEMPGGNQGVYDSYLATRTLMREGRLRLPPSPRLLAQLRAVTATPIGRGLTKITSPRRAGMGHGDVVSALVCAVWAVREDAVARANAAATRARGERIVGEIMFRRGDATPTMHLRRARARNDAHHAALVAANDPGAQERDAREWERICRSPPRLRMPSGRGRDGTGGGW